jgi:hypothetical protein
MNDIKDIEAWRRRWIELWYKNGEPSNDAIQLLTEYAAAVREGLAREAQCKATSAVLPNVKPPASSQNAKQNEEIIAEEVANLRIVEERFQLRARILYLREQVRDAREVLRVYPHLLKEAEAKWKRWETTMSEPMDCDAISRVICEFNNTGDLDGACHALCNEQHRRTRESTLRETQAERDALRTALRALVEQTHRCSRFLTDAVGVIQAEGICDDDDGENDEAMLVAANASKAADAAEALLASGGEAP